MSRNDIAVVILNWNCEDTIIECLESILSQSKPQHVVVVDNASEDNSLTLIRQVYPDIKILLNSKNLGFSGGVNTGIRYFSKLGYTHTALINPDATLESDWFKSMKKVIKNNPNCGIVASKLINSLDNTLDTSGEFINSWLLAGPRGRGEKADAFSDIEPITAASGGGSVYSMQMLDTVGLFDEDFFLYYEDVDISLRAQHAGYDILYNPDSITYHATSSSARKVPGLVHTHSVKNQTLLLLKNIRMRDLLRHGYKFVIVQVLISVRSIFTGRFVAQLRANYLVLKLLPSTIKKRRKVLKHSKLERTSHLISPDLPRGRSFRILGFIFR